MNKVGIVYRIFGTEDNMMRFFPLYFTSTHPMYDFPIGDFIRDNIKSWYINF